MQDFETQANATFHTLLHYMAQIPANGIIGDPVGSKSTAMEGLGGIGIVNELLLQSQTNVIEL